MGYHYPRASGDQRIFREDFLNIARTIDNNGEPVGAALISRGLSGGQARYYGAAHSVRYAGAVSIASHVIVSASGSNQALWSIGTAASRRMEVGIDATGRPYAWGTAQVLLGTAVSDGHHDMGWSIGADGSVWCVVDGELWGSGTITFGSTFDRMVVGGSCLGTLPWAGSTKDVHVYRGQMNEAEMAHAMGASVGFQPESLLVGRTGLYSNLGLPNAVVPNTQPVLLDGDMEGVAVLPWVAHSGATLSKSTTNPYAGARCLNALTDGTINSGAKQTIGLIADNRALILGYGRGDGTIKPSVLAGGATVDWTGTTSTAWQAIAAEGLVAAGGITYLITRDAAVGNIGFDNITAYNLSSRQLTCQGNLGHWQELVAANMPWGSDTRAPTSKPVNGRKVAYWDATRRFSTGPSKASTRWLHDGSGCTLAFVFKTALPAAAAFLINNLSSGWSVGSDLWVGPGGTIEWRTANALGAATYSLQATSAAGTIVANTMTLVTVRMNAANGAIVRKNGAQVAIDPTPVSFGAGDSTDLLKIGNGTNIASFGIQGSMLVPCFMVNAWVSDGELDRLERSFINYAGIP